MSTNKTRVVCWDFTSGSSHQLILQTEFDLYQEAIDYVESSISARPSNVAGVKMCLFSYDRVSFRYNIDGDGNVVKDEIAFPQLLT